MKTKSKTSGYILRRSAAALLFLGAIVALCSAVSLPNNHPKVPAAQTNSAFSATTHQNRRLSFADRIAYQRAIEGVYWRHRIWPATNPGPKPPLDKVMSQAQIEKKVTDYLRNSQALADDWQRPITAEQLQSEMVRIANHTKQPQVLREILATLGNDPFVIAECFARPVLTERLVTELNAQDEKPSTVAWLNQPLRSWLTKAGTQVPMTMAAVSSANYKLPVIAGPSSSCTDDTWTATTLTNAPSARSFNFAVWTGSEMIVWGGFDDFGPLNTGGRYNPSTDSWTATSTTNAPAPRGEGRAVWTGSEMIVWGGYDGNLFVTTGGRYNPSTDSWRPTSNTNAHEAGYLHSAVWTGSEMIVWGGCCYVNTGGRYNPITDRWTATSTTNAPSARGAHSAVWNDSGREMIVWGGYDNDGSGYLNTGGRYNPSTDSWTATSLTNAPSGRDFHAAAWTGSEMIVWGGYDGSSYLNTGGRYNTSTDSWTATSTNNALTARQDPSAIWTSSEMIVWGGDTGGTVFNTGGRYNPSTDSWRATSTTNAPSARTSLPLPAFWTGSEMIVWGGTDGISVFNTGGRYCAQSGPLITLDAHVHRQGGKRLVELTWSPADGGSVNVLRDGIVVHTTDDDGETQDRLGTHTGTFIYQVCETDSGDCSNEVTVRVRATDD
jgi:hypothetical protein